MTNAVFVVAESPRPRKLLSSPLQVQPVRYTDKKNEESRDAGNPPDTHNWSARLLSTNGRPIPAAAVARRHPKFPRTGVAISAITYMRTR